MNQTLVGLDFDEEEISWIGASFSIGGLFGALCAGKFPLSTKLILCVFVTQSGNFIILLLLGIYVKSIQ